MIHTVCKSIHIPSLLAPRPEGGYARAGSIPYMCPYMFCAHVQCARRESNRESYPIDHTIKITISPGEKLLDFVLVSLLGKIQGISATRQKGVRSGDLCGDVLHHAVYKRKRMARHARSRSVIRKHDRQLGVLVLPARETRPTHAGEVVHEDHAITNTQAAAREHMQSPLHTLRAVAPHRNAKNAHTNNTRATTHSEWAGLHSTEHLHVSTLSSMRHHLTLT
jgi:hypothetical protein